ncbi:hypothetical protein [Herbaspirillum sp. RV1423]|nr:hypothetical protein [Herbaspirillum sp. RV1423]
MKLLVIKTGTEPIQDTRGSFATHHSGAIFRTLYVHRRGIGLLHSANPL